MRISVLIPTRNRLSYLKLAVESVLRQASQDWELVISDNCSEEDVAGYAASLSDPRVRYTRTEQLVPVTENWTRALAHSSGDYVVMLGDDDALLDGYLDRMQELVREFDQPDIVYTKALLFTYPGVDPSHPSGFLMDHGCADFYDGASAPFILAHERAVQLVRDAMRFRMRYDFNAQFALIGRRLIDSMGRHGDFYQSAFPDYYSMNAAFLEASRIVADPFPRVIIGVTPKSYGFFHVNDREAEGRTFLEGTSAPETTGTNINVGWLSAMTALERGPGRELGLRVDRRRYRLVQAAHVYKRYRAGGGDRGDVRRFERELPIHERWMYRIVDGAIASVHRLLPQHLKAALASLAARRVGQLPSIDPAFVEGRYTDVMDVFDARASGSPPS